VSCTLILGPPGTGKTTACLGIVDDALARGVAPDRIGYVSFTRQAVGEAVGRAVERFGIARVDLPYFRTLHSFTFHSLGVSRSDVLGPKHLKEIANVTGLPVTYRYIEEGAPPSKGDQALALDNLARCTLRSLRATWDDSGWDTPLSWEELDYFTKYVRRYKAAHSLLDFTDMLERFVDRGEYPELDLLIVDEAQDLSTLQWRVVDGLRSHAAETYVAGDDDQAIFRWSGADVDRFLSLDVDHRRVLDQSYRIPSAVHAVAGRIVGQIQRRYDKAFAPRPDVGAVRRSMAVELAGDYTEGNWLILTRTRAQMLPVIEHVRHMGLSYSAPGHEPGECSELSAIVAWEALRKGQSITGASYRVAQRFTSDTLPDVDEGSVGPEVLGTAAEKPWYVALDLMPIDEREYYRAALRRGENLRKPRIRISTIHGAKGGEEDNVVLLTDTTARVDKGRDVRPDDEDRVWYVGATRARNQLVIVEPQGTRYYHIT